LNLLRSGGKRDNVPTHGTIFRIFAGRLLWVTVAINDEPNEYGDRQFTEGRSGLDWLGQNLGYAAVPLRQHVEGLTLA
jgi:hypothetical protein